MADQREIMRSNKRLYKSLDSDRRIIEQALETSARSTQLLRDTPVPDTFLGRTRQERVCPSGSDIDQQPPLK